MLSIHQCCFQLYPNKKFPLFLHWRVLTDHSLYLDHFKCCYWWWLWLWPKCRWWKPFRPRPTPERGCWSKWELNPRNWGKEFLKARTLRCEWNDYQFRENMLIMLIMVIMMVIMIEVQPVLIFLHKMCGTDGRHCWQVFLGTIPGLLLLRCKGFIFTLLLKRWHPHKQIVWAWLNQPEPCQVLASLLKALPTCIGGLLVNSLLLDPMVSVIYTGMGILFW